MAPYTFQLLKETSESIKIVSSKVCFIDLKQLDEFIKRVNQIRLCATPGCKGALTPINVRSVGLGGAFSSPMLVTVVLVSGHCLKHRSTSLVMLQKLVLLHRCLLSAGSGMYVHMQKMAIFSSMIFANTGNL